LSRNESGRFGADFVLYIGFVNVNMVTFHYTRHNPPSIIFLLINVSIKVRVITKLPNSEQSYKGKVKTHKYINRKNQYRRTKLTKRLKILFNSVLISSLLTSRVELGATVMFNKLNVLAYLVRNENAFVLILVSKVQ
jgi:hypothetical protein